VPRWTITPSFLFLNDALRRGRIPS